MIRWRKDCPGNRESPKFIISHAETGKKKARNASLDKTSWRSFLAEQPSECVMVMYGRGLVDNGSREALMPRMHCS